MTPGWDAIGASVRGAAHARSGLPNQDAVRWRRLSSGATPARGAAGDSGPMVAAVADGHGSSRCFRSDRGARLAVAAATEVLAELHAGAAGQGQTGTAGADVTDLGTLQRLADQLVRRWTQAVNLDLCDAPLTAAELRAVLTKEGPDARRAVWLNPTIAYGATLLAALVTDRFALYLQLGDGDILVTAEDGTVTRPLPVDPRLIANETTSLCSRDARHNFRVGLQVFDRGPVPALIALCTDGYGNSFRDQRGFLQVGTDLLVALRSEGPAAVAGSLEGWLAEASRFGSGDDVTLALLFRPQALQPAGTLRIAGGTAASTAPAAPAGGGEAALEPVGASVAAAGARCGWPQNS